MATSLDTQDQVVTCIIIFAENHYFESEEEPVLFTDPIYGTITANIVHLNNTVFVYSIAVVFDNDNSSSTCAVLFVDSMGNLKTTTKFIKRYVNTTVPLYNLTLFH